MIYIFCDSDTGGTPTNTTPDTSTSKYHTTTAWPAAGARWASIAAAVADATIVAIADDVTIFVRGVADFAAVSLGTLTSAISVLVQGDATGAVWDDSKATILGSASVGGCVALALAVPQTLRNIQLNNTQGSGTPRGAYCSGTGAAFLDNLKIKFTGTSTNNGTGIVGTSAPPVSVTATDCIVDGVNPNTAATYSGISLQTATVGNFYNCVFRGAGTGATNPDNCVNCVFFGFATQGGASGNYKNCATVNGTGTNPVTVSNYATVFADFANFDYRLLSGAALIGAGIGPQTDSSVPASDISGVQRSGTVSDVGAAMYVAAGTSTSSGLLNTDTLNRVVFNGASQTVTINETGTATDSSTVASTLAPSATEAGTAGDSSTSTSSSPTSSVAETGSVTDALSVSRQLVSSRSETLTGADTSITSSPNDKSITESGAAGDATTASVVSVISLQPQWITAVEAATMSAAVTVLGAQVANRYVNYVDAAVEVIYPETNVQPQYIIAA